MDERVARYLEHVRFEKRLAERTSTLYSLDLQKLSELALEAKLDLVQVQTRMCAGGWRRCTAAAAQVAASL